MNPPDDHHAAIAQVTASIPGMQGEGPLFQAPWQTRIFSLIVAMVQNRTFPWAAFQGRLADMITAMEQKELAQSADTVESRYFDCWLEAAEDTLIDQGLLTEQDVNNKIKSLGRLIAQTRHEQTVRHKNLAAD
ncbi:hypothetical protein RUESEDTHA_03755 [Ruegeria sp. THAF57]|uniref:nitrile hydratase accessory protein n=1 Tax=Ruegeria sp. THAF57 TaxID=2744555 RepID=UPI0015DDFC5F|nr:nitrile hydratase accessory protein [Ruegeria sp. THAF57]CAD0186844.1 hypothetical protein RUESEDTHA_03755 [Ruegeria sp. THAF57]